MKRFLKSKKGIALLATVVVAAMASGAFAFFTATGTGSGTASVGDAANNIYVSATTSGTLRPHGPAGTLSFSAKNFADFSQAISSIHATSVSACEVAWTTPDLSAYPVATPTCADSGPAAASDAACDTSLETGSSNTTTDAFWIPDVTVDPTLDGHLAPSANRAMTTQGSITMNDTGVSQDQCKNKNLLVTFTTA